MTQTYSSTRLAAACARAAFGRLTLGISFVLAALCLMLPPQAFGANVEITSAGPLTTVGITETGNLYATRTPGGKLYYGYPASDPGTAAGWFVYDVTNNVMYRPDNVPAGGAVVGTAWTAVSQTSQTGAGTIANPYKITATVTGGGLTVVITVTYVLGDDFYSTSAQVTDTSGAARDLRMFLGADLFYDGNDNGTPVYDPVTGSIGGVGLGSNAITGWFVPITPADHYYSGYYGTVWSQINAHQLSDSVDCAPGTCDNGVALQWNVTLPSKGSAAIQVGQLFNNTLMLLPPALPGGTVGAAYSQGFTPFGGLPPYDVSLQSGTVPPGLTFNPATLTLSGTPTTAGTYTFTLRVVDSDPGTPLQADVTYTVMIGNPRNVTPTTTAVPTLGDGALLALIVALGAAAAFGVTRRRAA